MAFIRRNSIAVPEADQQLTPGIGTPGVPGDDTFMDTKMQAALLGMSGADARQSLKHIGKEEVAKAIGILAEYKRGKQNLEDRIVQDEMWWKLRHWDTIRKSSHPEIISPEPSSAWLFNAILNKHADAMDNYPEPVTLPRERSDERCASMLSQVLPVILEYNNFDQTYSDNWWDKLKHGTSVYGIFWNSQKENGLGDIDIRAIDPLKLFWEPGVTDIQKSRNLFIVELVDEDLLEQQYPDHHGKLGGSAVNVKQYVYDDQVDTSTKSVVVDWYYKVQSPSGRTILHYAKFVGNELLYASENDPEFTDRGWYDDGQYPIVLDVLFPEKGTPFGFGYVAICKDPQLYIDKLSANILESSMMGTKKRFFASTSTGINHQQFLDWNEPIVDVEGEITDARLKEIVMQPLDQVYVSVLNLKIEEMKDTAANRDVNSGGTGGGVTAAAAIAALQEAGNKASRDMIAASYRTHVSINKMVIERMAQFYTENRTFRITGNTPTGYDFIDVNNAALAEQQIGIGTEGQPLFRKPIFDIKIKAQKKNPFSRMEQNERAKELYAAGFFNPEKATEALLALEMMEFEGVEKLREKVQEGQTLLNICQQMSQQIQQMSALISYLTNGNAAPGTVPMGQKTAQAPASAPGGPVPPGSGADGGDALASGVLEAQTPMTSYGERLAKRSTPSID